MDLKKIKEYEDEFPKGSIIDGVVDGAKYFESKFRIAWFLKEAYSSETDGFHVKKYYAQEDAYDNFFRNVATQTWHPIIYSSYSILNEFIEYDEMRWIKDKPEMCEIIKSIAIINANKFPSKTGTHTTFTNLNNGFIECKEIVEKQIEVLKPEINIFCSTFYLYKDYFGLTEENKFIRQNNIDSCSIYLKDDKLFLDVYHPANTTLKREVYVNQIVKAAEIWANERVSVS